VPQKKQTKYLLAFNNDILEMAPKLDITKIALDNIKMACDRLIEITHQPELIHNAKRLNPLTSKMITIPGNKPVFQSYNNINLKQVELAMEIVPANALTP
jgi:predicted DNA-binding protein YlxM (UPF0122 family)